MTLKEFRSRGLLRAIASLYDNERTARGLLLRLGFDPENIAAWGADVTAVDAWETAVRGIVNGRVRGVGLDSLVREAALDFPGHEVVGPAAERLALQPDRQESGTSLIVTGENDVHELIVRAREHAAALGVPGPVDLGYSTADTAQLRFPAAAPEQVHEVGQRLRQDGQTDRFVVVPNDESRDYLLHVLRIEGPDQSRYEVSDIPASTLLKDVVREVSHEYYGDTWPRDGQGHSRAAVTDHVDEATGAQRRLNPHASLRDNRVRDGDTLHMAPEATAGSISPLIRDEALARARSQVLAYARDHEGFEVSANATVAPTEYLFAFRAAGWGPPGKGGDPVPVDRHEVLLLLPTDFPMKAPVAFWQSPIFHPNIDRGTGKVCLGVLEDRYRPGLDFAELCQTLVDIAAYLNYEIREGYDSEARAWALSPAGQMAIERRGGRSVTRLLLSLFDDQVREPLPLRIRRVDS